VHNDQQFASGFQNSLCVCGFITTLCKHQAKVTQNREKENSYAIGKGSAQSRKYSRFKLGLGKD